MKFFIIKILFVIFYCLICYAYAKTDFFVYTYSSFVSPWGPGPIIKKSFEKICNCNLKFIALDNGVTLLNRLKIEGKHSLADVVLGIDNNLIKSAEESNLFVNSKVDIEKIKLPIKWKNNTFIPYDYGYFAFIYNKNYVTKPPKNFNELIDNSKLWKIIYQDPRTSTPGLGLLLWIQKIYGLNNTQIWKKLIKKTVTVTKGWSEAYNLFLKGESEFVFSYTSSPCYHMLIERNDNYTAAIFDDGHYIHIELLAQLANSKHPKLSQKFINFMLSEKIQKILPITNWMYPVIDINLPKVYKQIKVPNKSFQFDSEYIANNRKHWLYIWEKSVSHF